MDLLCARGLTKRFGSVIALDGLSLNVKSGQIVSVLGPNGAGKSTLLRIVGTLVIPDEGRVTVSGIDVVADSDAARRRLGLMIGDERSLYWRLSGRHNLEFFAALHGMRRRRARERSEELLDFIGLAPEADRPVRGYSSGMRARLSLARALLGDPPLLLLDEPTRSLDPLAASNFRETAIRLAGSEGAGIVLATHDLHEAAAISDRILVLAKGRIVLDQSGSTDSAQLDGAMRAAVAADSPVSGDLDAVNG